MNRLGTTSTNLHEFFEHATVDAFFKKRSTIIDSKLVFTVDKAIVKVTVKEFMLPAARGDDDDDDDGEVPIPGDCGMNMFVTQYVVADDGTKVVYCYLVTIHNPLQYNYIVALLSDGLSFRQISRVVQENRDRLGSASKLGGVSEGDASKFLRVTCNLGLQMISELMSLSWAFSVENDVSTDGFGSSHLDVRIQRPGRDVADDIFSFYLLAVPLFKAAHSGASLFISFLKVFDALCPAWKAKIICSSTDSAKSMTGCNVGFTTQLANVVIGGKLYRVWGLAHQLDIIIKAGLHAIANTGEFALFQVETTIVARLRRQDTLIRRMGSKCPYYINVRWTSFSKVLKWLLENLKTVCAYFTVKRYQHALIQEWWLFSMVAQHFILTVNITFCALQTNSAGVSKHYNNVLKLLLQLKEHFSAKRNESLDVYTPLAFAGDSLSEVQFKVTCSGMQILLHSIT